MSIINLAKPDSITEMLQYLNQQYDDYFTLEREISFSLSRIGRRLFVKSKKYPDIPVYVEQTKQTGKETKKDTYLFVKYHDQIVSYIDDVITSVLGDVKKYVFFRAGNNNLIPSGNDPLSFEKFALRNDVKIIFDSLIFVDTSKFDAESISEKINNKLSESDFNLNGVLRIYDLCQIKDEINDDVYSEFVSKNNADKILKLNSVKK